MANSLVLNVIVYVPIKVVEIERREYTNDRKQVNETVVVCGVGNATTKNVDVGNPSSIVKISALEVLGSNCEVKCSPDDWKKYFSNSIEPGKSYTLACWVTAYAGNFGLKLHSVIKEHSSYDSLNSPAVTAA